MYTIVGANINFTANVIKENGNILLSIPKGGPAYVVNTGTATGYKMIVQLDSVNKNSPETFNVYSLPGTLPTTTSVTPTNTDVVTGINPQGGEAQGMISAPIPNPSQNKTIIAYQLPPKTQADLIIYNISGTELKRYAVDSNFNTLELDNTDLPSGTYLYSLSKGNLQETKKMVIIK